MTNDERSVTTKTERSAALYWRAYGGWSALFSSPYFITALVLAVPFTWGTYFHEEWWEVFIAIIPNLLGFSIGAYALIIGLGNEKFLLIITGGSDSKEVSPYLEVSSTFVHFILVQVIALFLLLACKFLYVPMPDFIKEVPSCLYSLMKFIFYYITSASSLYALIMVISAAFHLLRLGSWLDLYFSIKRNSNK